MILRVLAFAGGVTGAAAGAQFPEFSQQYIQRLGGTVDALAGVIDDFDASAAAVGMARPDALAQMQGTPFLDRRRADMTYTIARFERLDADLRLLQGQGPFIRAYHITRFTDKETLQAALGAYQPAVPLTVAGAIFGMIGLVLGAGFCSFGGRLLRWPFRRKAA